MPPLQSGSPAAPERSNCAHRTGFRFPHRFTPARVMMQRTVTGTMTSWTPRPTQSHKVSRRHTLNWRDRPEFQQRSPLRVTWKPSPGSSITGGYPAVDTFGRTNMWEIMDGKTGLQLGLLPGAAKNYTGALTDYMSPAQRWVVSPNNDTIYGAGFADLTDETAVIQTPTEVPDGHYWTIQIVDVLTNVTHQLGSATGTPSGKFLLVGPDWDGELPEDFLDVLRSPTNVAGVFPRSFAARSEASKQQARRCSTRSACTRSARIDPARGPSATRPTPRTRSTLRASPPKCWRPIPTPVDLNG